MTAQSMVYVVMENVFKADFMTHVYVTDTL